MVSVNIVASVFLVVVVNLAQQGTALDCYQCNSFLKQDCWDLSEETRGMHLKPCKGNATGCQKQKQELYYNDDYQERIYRGCMYVDAPNKCTQRTGTYRVKIVYCYCEEEGCNAGFRLHTSIVTVLFASGLVYFFSRHM
ncbi:uncharacterized protein LOC121379045 [Gigantopelta aegis]|uniref:uncharacterized protein LOC121379045 n=1 Tax=Gigantopelta aegis TaxID=1735272 RepID=UPI001B88835A|nr:uncharacterized protein LOC121379045 [Gigantopelta aegis]